MTKYILLTVCAIAVASVNLHAGDGCGGCKGEDKGKEKTEQTS